MPRSEKRKGVLGNEYVVHFDDAGNEIGRSEASKTLFGDKVTKRHDSEGNHISTSHDEETLFSGKHTVTRKESGETLITTKESPLFGEPHTVTRNSHGEVVSRTYTRRRLFGDDYQETVPTKKPVHQGGGGSDSSGEGDGGISGTAASIIALAALVFLIFFVFFVISVVLTILFLALGFSILWGSAPALAIILAFFQSKKLQLNLTTERLLNATIKMDCHRKTPRSFVDKSFVSSVIGWREHLLLPTGAGLFIALAVGVTTSVTSPRFYEPLLCAAAGITGVVFAWLAARQIYVWRISESVFSRNGLPSGRMAILPNIALSVAALWIAISLFATLFIAITGASLFDIFSEEQHSRKPPTSSTKPELSPHSDSALNSQNSKIGNPTRPSTQTGSSPISPPIDRTIDSSLIPEGFSVPDSTLSPNKRYGVIAPDWLHYDENIQGQNKLLDLRAGSILATMDTQTFVSDSSGKTMNHVYVSSPWTSDGSVLAWVVSGRWTPFYYNLFKVKDGKVIWRSEILRTAQREILTKTKFAVPANYAKAVEWTKGDREGFPDGFMIDIDIPKSGFSLPLLCRVTLTSNPKEIADIPPGAWLQSSIEATIQSDGNLSFSNFRIDRADAPDSPSSSTSTFPSKTFWSEVNALLAEQSRIDRNLENGDLIITFVWLERFGANRWTVPLTEIDFVGIQIGKPAEEGAFSGVHFVSLPFREGSSVLEERWAVNLDGQWNPSLPPNGQGRNNDALSIFTKGATESRQLADLLETLQRRMSDYRPEKDVSPQRNERDTADPIFTYQARLSRADLTRRKDGIDLRSIPNIKPSDLLLQERYNFHKYDMVDLEDEAEVSLIKATDSRYRALFEGKPVTFEDTDIQRAFFAGEAVIQVMVYEDRIFVGPAGTRSAVSGRQRKLTTPQSPSQSDNRKKQTPPSGNSALRERTKGLDNL